jgi:hypothetical protein
VGLEKNSKQPTGFQQEIADKLNVDIANCTYEMAAARLHDFLSSAIIDYPPSEPTERQFELADELGVDISQETRRTAKILIKEHLFDINQRALNKLGIKKGDSISYCRENGEIVETRIISTIKPNGRIFYKGTDFRQDYASLLIKRKIKINAT